MHVAFSGGIPPSPACGWAGYGDTDRKSQALVLSGPGASPGRQLSRSGPPAQIIPRDLTSLWARIDKVSRGAGSTRPGNRSKKPSGGQIERGGSVFALPLEGRKNRRVGGGKANQRGGRGPRDAAGRCASMADIGWITGHSYIVYGPSRSAPRASSMKACRPIPTSAALAPGPGRGFRRAKAGDVSTLANSEVADELRRKAETENWPAQRQQGRSERRSQDAAGDRTAGTSFVARGAAGLMALPCAGSGELSRPRHRDASDLRRAA